MSGELSALSRAGFLVAGAANATFGIALLTGKGFPRHEIASTLARQNYGDETNFDLSALKGTEIQLKGKGVILACLGGAMLIGVGKKDRSLLAHLAALILVGDLGFLGLNLYQKSKDAEYPVVPSERKTLFVGMTYAALEAVGLTIHLVQQSARG
jgi:hypothetical protein